ncbi:MAG: DUF455 family protein [Bdellovibrionota bacterium]|nr:DUF455 family protein [Bdellovibrionota bacterium]
MEIREFAENLLREPDLDKRLFLPAEFTDKDPEFKKALPDRPERFNANQVEGRPSYSFPKAKDLENSENLARAMHFFANHELLAIELMALALLKFPEAPKAFRRGLVKEITEEINHLRLYQARMEKEGMSFGDISPNDYFWRVLSDMKHPIDFCSKMSLGFEQANLDFSKYFQNCFHELGDQDSLDILNVVYEDEIRHVSFGLHWFEKWSDAPRASLFDRHKNSLVFPMGLQRAKAQGKFFDEEGRKRAGFDDDYIKRLKLYRSSRERPPVLRLFNPEVEAEISSLKNTYTPDKLTQNLKRSLQHLPHLFSLEQDILLVQDYSSEEYKEDLVKLGFPYCEEVKYSNWKAIRRSRKIADFRPWGNSYTSSKVLLENESEEFREHLDKYECFHTQQKSLELLREFLDLFSGKYPQLIRVEDLAIEVKELEDIEKWSHFPAVVKAPLALSGRGLSFVESKEQLRGLSEKLLKTNSSFVLEKKFDRSMDFSLQMDFNEQKASFNSGFARFFADPKGKYQGGVIGKNFFDSVDDRINRFWNEGNEFGLNVYNLLEDLKIFLTEKLKELQYRSVLGVDCFIFEKNNKLYVKPLVEINLRHNMGFIKSKLSQKVRPGIKAFFHVVHKRHFLGLQNLDTKSFNDLRSKFPLKWDEKGIIDGFAFLSDPFVEGDFVAIIQIADSFSDSLQLLGKRFG